LEDRSLVYGRRQGKLQEITGNKGKQGSRKRRMLWKIKGKEGKRVKKA
jgi:hypothetical protein